MKFKFNIICFLFAFLILFGFKSDTYAASSTLTPESIYVPITKSWKYWWGNWEKVNEQHTDVITVLQAICDTYNQGECACIFDYFNGTYHRCCVFTWDELPQSRVNHYKTLCNNNGYEYLFYNYCYKDEMIYYIDVYDTFNIANSCGVYRMYCDDTQSAGYYYSYSTNNVVRGYKPSVIFLKDGSSTSDYDSTVGYLSNVVVKRGSSMLLTAIDTDITNLIDRFSWSSVTSTGKSLDGVDIKIVFYRNEENAVEKELHFDCPPNEYFFDWGSFVELNLKDWLVGSLYRYEIFLRPTVGGSYGDYCYFNVNFPSTALEQMQGTIDPTYLTDDIQYCPSVGNVKDFNNFERPDKTTPIYVPHYVTNNRPSDDIKDDLRDDDKVPPSDPSHSTVINNINNVVNNYDNEEGNGLIDSISDLLGFFKNFLSFIGLFVSSVLSSLTFIPNWVIKLMEGTILAFIVISIIKTVIK